MGSETVSVSLLGPSSKQINKEKKTRILITVVSIVSGRPNFISFVYALFMRHLDVFLQIGVLFPLETLTKRL